MKERILIKTNIVFPLLSHPDNSRKVFIFFSQRKKNIIQYFCYQNIYIFSAHIKLFLILFCLEIVIL